MPRVLTLDGALVACSVGLVEDDALIATSRGDATSLALMAEALLAATGRVDLVAVTVGPGSFTGLRAAISLALGIGIGAGVEVRGVSLGAAFEAMVQTDRAVWTAIDSKRATVFLERGGAVAAVALDALPNPSGKVAIAGDAAIAVTCRLAARGDDVQLLDARAPSPLGIARAALGGRTRPSLPLYVDPPLAFPGPAGRPPPA